MGAEQDRSVEKTLSSLANIIIPRIDFDQEITVEEAVDFLNLILHAPDPPPPRHWKIRLDVPEKLKMAKIPLVGKDLHLHEILGKIADTIGAEVVPRWCRPAMATSCANLNPSRPMRRMDGHHRFRRKGKTLQRVPPNKSLRTTI